MFVLPGQLGFGSPGALILVTGLFTELFAATFNLVSGSFSHSGGTGYLETQRAWLRIEPLKGCAVGATAWASARPRHPRSFSTLASCLRRWSPASARLERSVGLESESWNGLPKR